MSVPWKPVQKCPPKQARQSRPGSGSLLPHGPGRAARAAGAAGAPGATHRAAARAAGPGELPVGQACGRVSKQKRPPALPGGPASRGGALLSLFELEEQQVVKGGGEPFSHLILKTKQKKKNPTQKLNPRME